MMLSNVIIILIEEFTGEYPTPQPLVVLLLNLPWLLMPLYIIFRMSLRSHPFTGYVPESAANVASMAPNDQPGK